MASRRRYAYLLVLSLLAFTFVYRIAFQTPSPIINQSAVQQLGQNG
jgi:hypothetical protein